MPVGRAGGEDRAFALGPGAGVEQVGVRVGAEQPHAVLGAGARGRVGDEDLAVADDRVGAFVDGEADGLPVVFGAGELHGFALDGPGVGEFGEEQARVRVGERGVVLGPAQVARPVVGEGGRVEGERVDRGRDLALLGPFAGQRVARCGSRGRTCGCATRRRSPIRPRRRRSRRTRRRRSSAVPAPRCASPWGRRGAGPRWWSPRRRAGRGGCRRRAARSGRRPEPWP